MVPITVFRHHLQTVLMAHAHQLVKWARYIGTLDHGAEVEGTKLLSLCLSVAMLRSDCLSRSITLVIMVLVGHTWLSFTITSIFEHPIRC